MIEKDNMVINEKPLKIIIETNPDITNYETPFSITVNGKHLENVKRFYLDWDKEKLNEIVKNGGSTIIYPHPFNFGVEYSWDIENENFSMVQEE
jgi:hypothetical protein